MALVAVVIFVGIGCSNDSQEAETPEDTAQQDTPLLTQAEACSLVYQYLDARLYEASYRAKLTSWGGRGGAVYRGNHTWTVNTLYLGFWTVYERTAVVQPLDQVAMLIVRDHFL